MKKALSIILCLAMLMSTVPMSVFAAPSAVTVGESASEIGGAALAGETYTVTYDEGTGSTRVTNMPEDEEVSGEYTVSSVTPKRRGYTFEGWTLTPGGSETVDSLNINKPTTLYAKWGKGGYTAEFNNVKEWTAAEDGSGKIVFSDGNSVDTCVGIHVDDFTYNSEGTGSADMTIAGNDFYFRLVAGGTTSINIDAVKKVIIGFKTSAPATTSMGCSLFFATKDATGNWIAEFDESNGLAKYVANRFVNLSCKPTGNADEIQEFVIDTSVKPDLWKGYLHHFRLDIENSANFVGYDYSIDYIKLVGNQSVEYIDLTMPAPKASDVAYDESKLADAYEGFEVTNVEWSGAELVDGKYFAGGTAYTATVELAPKTGYVLSDAPAASTINGDAATAATANGVTTVTYTFPATEELSEIELYVGVKDDAAAEITESLGKLQLVADVYSDADVSGEVYWSIDDSQKRYASVDKNGVVTANTDCEELVVTATSKYDPSVKATIVIKISGQVPESNIYFHKGTGEEVTNMPESTLGKDEFVLPTDVIPVRSGYAFKGWSKELGGEIIKVDDVHEDTTYYAVWGYCKGEEYDDSENIFTITHASNYIEDGALVVIPDNGNLKEGIQIQAGNGIFGARNRLLTDDIEYIQIKTNIAPDETELCTYVQSGTKAGKELTAWNEGANKRLYSNKARISQYPDQNIFDYVEQDGEWYIYSVPTSLLNNWENYLNQIRFNFVRSDADSATDTRLEFDAGSIYKIDYIRFIGRDIPAMDITDVSVPAVKGEASTSVTVVQDEAFKVTSVTWSPELLGGLYFGSNTEYTVTMTVEALDGYNSFSNPAARISVNGNDATYTRNSSTKGKITYTFPATENVGDLSLVNVTLHESVDGGTTTETKQIFSGDDFDLDNFVPTSAPTGYRWYGWSETSGGEAITEPVNLTEDADFYALYEIITEFDFSKESHKSEVNVSVENATLTYDGAWAVVTPDNDKSAATLVLDGMSIAGANYDYIEIIYDGSLEELGLDNKFNESFAPLLTVYGSSTSTEVALVKAEPVIASHRVSYKYTYDLTVNGKPTTITKLELAPYTGKPAWAVTSVKFVPNVVIEDPVEISKITLPEPWEIPDTSAVVSENYELVSFTWSSTNGFNENGTFKAETEYTATLVIKPKTGYKITQRSAYYEGELLSGRGVVTLNSTTGMLTVKKKFPATAKLVDFTLSVPDAAISVADGTVTLKPVFTPVNAGETVPVTTVSWTIVSNGPDGKSATIDENGVVKAAFDGDVVVVATADYNPDVSASATVTITNQIPYYVVSFDANTTSEVTNMPADAYVKFDYTLPKSEPVRPGFIFAGWLEDPTDTVPVTKAYITKDVTYYALWVRGFSWEFNDGKPVFTAHSAMSNLKFDGSEGVMSFELIGTDPQIYIRPAEGDDYIFNGGDYRKMEARVKTSDPAGFNWGMYFESIDEFGNVLGPSYAADSTRYVANFSRQVFSTNPDEFTTISFDLSSKSDWVNGYPTVIRLDLPDDGTSASVGVKYTFDYIRFVNYETGVVEVTGIDTPVAKAIIDTDAVSEDEAKYVVTDVSWEGDILHGYYYGANTEYTVCVTVKGAPGYFVSDAPSKATINGKNVTATEYNAETGELTLKYTFPATGDIDNDTAYDITLVSKDDNGDYIYESRTLFEGDTFALGSYVASSVPSGKRWIGWSEEEDAVSDSAGDSITITADKTYYAVYEDMLGFDYSNYYHTVGTTSRYSVGELSFKQDLAIMSVDSKLADAALVTPVMNIDGSDFAFVEVYYSKTMTSIHDKTKYGNVFSDVLSPALKFSTMDVTADYKYAGELVSSETVTIDGRLYQKYVYDMTGVPAWYGKIACLCVEPYNGYPNWGVRKIDLIPAETIYETAKISLDEPETWDAPASVGEVSVNGSFEILDIVWSPEDETFKAEKMYTAKVIYKPVSGYKLGAVSAEINGEAAIVADNGNGTYTATYTFGATEALSDVEVTINGYNEITLKGRYLDLEAEVTALDGSNIPMGDVTWSIESVDSEIELARISESGRVYPISNGDVLVTATSVYNPAFSATHEISISGQAELVKLVFDKNTQDEVEGIPEPIYVYGNFVPENYAISRDGFFFKGWSVNEDALEPDKSFNITEDTVLYAKWGAGYEWSFDNASTAIPKNWDKQATYKDGIATITPNESSGQVVITGNGYAKTLGIETAKHSILEIRYSVPMATMVKCYLQSATADGATKSPWNESAAKGSTTGSTRPANAAGEFQSVTFDLSSHENWNMYPYVEQVRMDLPQAGPTQTVQIDYVRLHTSERKVIFDGNGGLIPYPYAEGVVESYKETRTTGSMTLPTAEREGYKFLGWAKTPEVVLNENTGLYSTVYNNTFVVSDNVTLYAIWKEHVSTTVESEEVVAPTVSLGNVAADESIIIEVVDADGNAVEVEEVTITYTDAEGNSGSVNVPGDALNNPVNLEDYGVEGDISNIEVVLPEALYEAGTQVNVATVSNEIASQVTSDNTGIDGPDLIPQASCVIVAEINTNPNTKPKYPALAGGSVGETAPKTTVTPANKVVKVPARPADDAQPAAGTGTASGTGSASAASSKFALSKTYDGRFVDVTSANWFYADVEKSYRLGLMNGKTDTTFVPDGTVTIAEAVTVAARMNSIYNKAEIPAAAAGQKWYQPYVDYATKKAIITNGQYSDYTAPATREQVALMFVRALPASWYEQKNLFLTIPDVPASSSSFAAIQRLYNAGIVTGVDASYNFKPGDNIKRSEISAIINRVALKDSRLRVVTEDEKNNKMKVFNVDDIMSTLIIGNCVEKAFVEKDGTAYAEPAKADPVINGLQTLMGGSVNADEYKKITVEFTSGKASSMVGKQSQLFFSADGTLSEANSLRGKVEKNGDGTLKVVFDGNSNAGWKGIMTTVRFDPWNDMADFGLISITFA